jgi:hypothetical protein
MIQIPEPHIMSLKRIEGQTSAPTWTNSSPYCRLIRNPLETLHCPCWLVLVTTFGWVVVLFLLEIIKILLNFWLLSGGLWKSGTCKACAFGQCGEAKVINLFGYLRLATLPRPAFGLFDSCLRRTGHPGHALAGRFPMGMCCVCEVPNKWPRDSQVHYF